MADNTTQAANLNDLFNKEAEGEQAISTESETEEESKNTETTEGESTEKAETKTEEKPKSESDIILDLLSKAKAEKEQKEEEAKYASYSRDDLAKELEKARAENAKRRIKSKEERETLLSEIEKMKEELTPLQEQSNLLQELKDKEEDAKRSAADKIAHRDQLYMKERERAEALSAKMQEIDNKYNEILKQKEEEFTSKITSLESQLGTYDKVYKDRLDAELIEISDEYKPIATTLIKGAEDTAEALRIILDAKKLNLFGEKIIKIDHSTPTPSSVKKKTAEAQNEPYYNPVVQTPQGQTIIQRQQVDPHGALSEILKKKANKYFKKNE